MTASKYDHKAIEKKWQDKWAKDNLYKTPQDPKTEKNFVLDMFPYPSGATMHVGHLEGYIGTDILSRFLRMQGKSVLHPMGWDAFGLPAENYAIKTGIHPDKSTHDNIKTFKRQLMTSGLSYDWEREIDTSDPDFCKWTQWLFILMFKNGLAYKKKSPVNWCPKDETVLANEQVIDGKCERCDTPVIKKDLDQWFFKITAYADRLIEGLQDIDWLEEVKIQQKNWIGRSEGMKIKFEDIEVFTTRPDTLSGATFIALAPNHPSLDKKYEFDMETKEKQGEFTGRYVKNPLTGKKMPVWAVNYVNLDYGTGAIMGVPFLDDRDREFATKYQLDIVEMEPDHSIAKTLEEKGWGEKFVSYHMRDWLISRQRYWGAPIPMIYCDDCGWQPVSEDQLPVMLPMDVDFLPHGESPIARSKSFQEGVTCPKCGKKAKREVDTMDGYVDSSWYYIRFVDPKNKNRFADPDKIKAWLPVDNYVGGGHVVQHLLFARFFWKVLYDQGLVGKSLGDEPFLRLRAPGWILGPDSRKMSKRWGNVITPDDIIPKFGADTLRLYEMFMGPFDVVKPWSISGVEGMARFVNKLWDIFTNVSSKDSDNDSKLTTKLHQTIKKVTHDLETFNYNTAISTLMEYVNQMREAQNYTKDYTRPLIQMIAPFAPHLAEEAWKMIGEEYSVHTSKWPKYKEELTQVDEVTLIIQVNGKLRSQIVMDKESASNEDEVTKISQNDENVSKWIDGKKIIKIIFVPNKLINFVVKDN
ncbi:leucine--tRNA ligase [Candidatus Microgenomates bacterium]|nr:leucine--tRNA ligase [Candidatus Microgenomates bacterium]